MGIFTLHGNRFRTEPGIVIVSLDNISTEELLMQFCCSKVVVIELPDIVFSKFAWISAALNGGPV